MKGTAPVCRSDNGSGWKAGPARAGGLEAAGQRACASLGRWGVRRGFFFLSFLNHNHEQGRSKARPARLVEVISGGLCWVETVREGGPV